MIEVMIVVAIVAILAAIALPNYADYVKRLQQADPDLANQVRSFDGVTQVLDWMKQRDIRREGIDFVSHDEFNYDLLLHLLPEEKWIVFGVS